MEHWICTFNILGHPVSANMDTLITMWFTMILLIILALFTTRKTSLVPSKLQLAAEGIIKYFGTNYLVLFIMERFKRLCSYSVLNKKNN